MIESELGLRRRRESGFTLVELMITVAILGVLATLAIPAFMGYVNRSKSSEALANLNMIFKGAASYYSGEMSRKGIGASITGYCTVGDQTPMPATPKASKQAMGVPAPTSSFRAIHFQIADFVYYSYGLTSVDPSGGLCSHQKNTPGLYTFYANGDLDGDLTQSTFELSAGSDESNTLYHARGMYVKNETE